MTRIEKYAPEKLSQVDLKPRGRVYPSPVSWRDQILYQLLPDRFSDAQENKRPLFNYKNPTEFRVTDKAAWMAAGTKFNGGTINGIRSKLNYLKNLGVTTLWVNPPWKQRCDLETYHGYGIQNFLDIDPRFGTRQDLRDLVDDAHDLGMYVILDIIYNHSGNNWFYVGPNGEPSSTMPYRFSPPYEIQGWRSARGKCVSHCESLEEGAWPEEFQNPEFYTRAGEIGNWGIAYWEDPMSPDLQFRRGDFYDLKDMNLEDDQVIRALAKVYQYWIALSDCDGFRMDAVKHVSVQASHKICTAIHEFCQLIGKENFFLTGEITDRNIAPGYVDLFGRNLDAILGIIDMPNKLTALLRGENNPLEVFGRYDTHTPEGGYLQLGKFVVLVVDDHDMSSRAKKERFGSHHDAPNFYQQVAHLVGVELTIPGIPSIYYGTEQAFDGNEGYHDYKIESRRFAEDRYVREAMFGGLFGAFETTGCHFFNPDHPTYVRIGAIANLRNQKDSVGMALRRGHLYLRETSFCGYPFALPRQGELVAWSMIFLDTEVLIALNANPWEGRGAEVTIDAAIHPKDSTLQILYSGDWDEKDLKSKPKNQTVKIQHQGDGRATVRIDLPPSGMIILA